MQGVTILACALWQARRCRKPAPCTCVTNTAPQLSTNPVIFQILQTPQEIARPDIFWYDAPTKIDLPFNIVGLLAFEFWAMQFVELKRWQDFKNPGSVDQDPLFPNNKLKPHEVRRATRSQFCSSFCS